MRLLAVLLPVAGLGLAGGVASNAPGVAEVAGLSAPAETGAEQQQRQQGIFYRANSLIMSTLHIEAALPDTTHRFRQLTECSGSQCEPLDPATGERNTSSLGEAEIVPGDAEALGSAHGITLTSEYAHHEGVAITAFGAWMEHSNFGLFDEQIQGADVEHRILYALALGELTNRPGTGRILRQGLPAIRGIRLAHRLRAPACNIYRVVPARSAEEEAVPRTRAAKLS